MPRKVYPYADIVVESCSSYSAFAIGIVMNRVDGLVLVVPGDEQRGGLHVCVGCAAMRPIWLLAKDQSRFRELLVSYVIASCTSEVAAEEVAVAGMGFECTLLRSQDAAARNPTQTRDTWFHWTRRSG